MPAPLRLRPLVCEVVIPQTEHPHSYERQLMKKNTILAHGSAFLAAAVLAGCAPFGGEAPGAASASSCPAAVYQDASVDLSGYQTPDGIAIVVANTANSPAPTLSGTASALVEDLMTDQTLPTLWSATGNPSQIRVPLQTISATNSRKKNQTRVANNLVRIDDAIKTTPSTPGMSLFEGIGVALDALASQGVSSPWIILVGSGLDDTGPMTTTTGILGEDPARVADRVAATNPGMRLDGITILATSLGYTAPPQTPPSDAQRQLISDTWDATLTRLGATVVQDPLPAPACSVNSDQPVIPTELPEITVKCEAQKLTYELPSALLFGGDSAELRQNVAALLDEPVQILLDNPSAQVELVGHTASTQETTDDQSVQLSTRRAEAVATVLEAGGIDLSRITWRGVGDTEPRHEDLNADGTQNEHAAEERRVDLFITGVASCPDR